MPYGLLASGVRGLLEIFSWLLSQKRVRRGLNYAAAFLRMSQFLERVLMKHKGIKNSLASKLKIYFICSIRTRSRK